MNYKQYINLKCEFLPCHDLKEWHSCLFCYCPLFLLSCPGNFNILPSGFKDCSKCVMPHTEDGWDNIQGELQKQIYNQGQQQKVQLEG